MDGMMDRYSANSPVNHKVKNSRGEWQDRQYADGYSPGRSDVVGGSRTAPATDHSPDFVNHNSTSNMQYHKKNEYALQSPNMVLPLNPSTTSPTENLRNGVESQKGVKFNANIQPDSTGKSEVNEEKEMSQKRQIYPLPRRGGRKKTLSLNPEEREALENLIEEVIMDGVVDSESASSDEDSDSKDKKSKKDGNANEGDGPSQNADSKFRKSSNEKGKSPKKYYPGQLKVALKHMTDLLPRFSRKLKKAEKYLNITQQASRIDEEDEEDLGATAPKR